MRERVVIYGEYPPAPGPAAAGTLEAVRARLAGGADVVVVSPRPSAAHHHADLGTVWGAARLARLSAGAELQVALDPALLADQSGRGGAAQALLALAVAGARRATVHVGPLGPAAGRGRVRLVLGRAGTVTAASDADADALRRAGLPPRRLSVRPPAAAAAATAAGAVSAAPGSDGPGPNGGGADPGPARRPAWELGEQPEREELEAAVRRRAAADREAAAGNTAASTWPLHLLGPYASPSPSSGRPLFAVAKQVVYRLTAWFVMPMAEYVTQLQQATIDSIGSHAALPDHAGDRRPTTR